MAAYIIKRVAVAILTLLLIMCITFLLMNAVPGSPFLTEKSTPEMIARANAKYGLDKPLYVQLFNYIKNYLHGDMGTSLKMQEGTAVTKIIFQEGKFALSFKLGVRAVIPAVLVGVPLGCLAAYNRGRWVDSVLRVITTLGVAVPSFVLCAVLLIFLGVKLKWVPVISGSLTTPKAYIAPVIGLAFYPMCYVAKLTRTSMLDALGQDYIRTARAKGLKTSRIIFKHALRNSLIPVITYAGPQIAYIITGSMVIETIFTVGGLGSKFVSGINNRDYTLIMATTIFLAVLMVVANLICDLLYKLVDPRIKYD